MALKIESLDIHRGIPPSQQGEHALFQRHAADAVAQFAPVIEQSGLERFLQTGNSAALLPSVREAAAKLQEGRNAIAEILARPAVEEQLDLIHRTYAAADEIVFARLGRADTREVKMAQFALRLAMFAGLFDYNTDFDGTGTRLEDYRLPGETDKLLLDSPVVDPLEEQAKGSHIHENSQIPLHLYTSSVIRQEMQRRYPKLYEWGAQFIPFRPGWPELIKFLNKNHATTRIISAGSVLVVNAAIRRAGLQDENVHVWAVNTDPKYGVVSWDKGNMIQLAAARAGNRLQIYAGDGGSDKPTLEAQSRRVIGAIMTYSDGQHTSDDQFTQEAKRERQKDQSIVYFEYTDGSDIQQTIEEAQGFNFEKELGMTKEEAVAAAEALLRQNQQTHSRRLLHLQPTTA